MENNVNKTTQTPAAPATDDLDLILSEPASKPTAKPVGTPATPAPAPSTKINNPFEVSKYKSDKINSARHIATHKFIPSKVGMTVGIIGLIISGVALLGAVLMLIL